MTKDTFRPSRTVAFEVTINGLLTKRQAMLTEAERLQERIEEIRGDLIALDRTLATLGYNGDLDAMLPRQRRKMVFSRGELILAHGKTPNDEP